MHVERNAEMAAHRVHRADVIPVRVREQHGGGLVLLRRPDDPLPLRAGVHDEAAPRFGVHHQIAIFLKGPYGQAFHIDPSHLYRSLLSSKPPA